MARTVKKGRDAKTGQFVSISYAQKHPSTTVVEKVKVGPITEIRAQPVVPTGRYLKALVFHFAYVDHGQGRHPQNVRHIVGLGQYVAAFFYEVIHRQVQTFVKDAHVHPIILLDRCFPLGFLIGESRLIGTGLQAASRAKIVTVNILIASRSVTKGTGKIKETVAAHGVIAHQSYRRAQLEILHDRLQRFAFAPEAPLL